MGFNLGKNYLLRYFYLLRISFHPILFGIIYEIFEYVFAVNKGNNFLMVFKGIQFISVVIGKLKCLAVNQTAVVNIEKVI